MRPRDWRLIPTIVLAVLLTGLLIAPSVALAASNTLTWTDNSGNEANFDIQRGTAATVAACQVGVTFAPLVSVGANVVTYTDAAVVEGVTYCYRVDASNTAGVSAFSNIAGRTVPFTVPSAPSTLGVAGGL